jgi:hypothetical protein
MPSRPPKPALPPPPVCVVHNMAVRGECPACERELRTAKVFAFTMLGLLVAAVVLFAFFAVG